MSERDFEQQAEEFLEHMSDEQPVGKVPEWFLWKELEDGVSE